MDQSLPDYSLPVRLERFEDQIAVLRSENFGEFRWPTVNLPKNIQIGETIILKVVIHKNEQEEKYARMRALLEELIN